MSFLFRRGTHGCFAPNKNIFPFWTVLFRENSKRIFIIDPFILLYSQCHVILMDELTMLTFPFLVVRRILTTAHQTHVSILVNVEMVSTIILATAFHHILVKTVRLIEIHASQLILVSLTIHVSMIHKKVRIGLCFLCRSQFWFWFQFQFQFQF